MELKQLIADEDAVSPVIGVILMVAITVILAAVIGTFVLGLGEQVQSTTPSASFSFDLDTSSNGVVCSSEALDDGTQNAGSTTGEGELTITHDGGDKIDTSQSSLEISDDDGNKDTWSNCGGTGTEVSAGDQANPEVETNDVIRVIWTSEGGGNSGTIGRWSGPDA